MKLFAIGDSLSQGFRSAAAAEADQSYVKLVADILGARPFNVCNHWPQGGIPFNLEEVLRVLEKRFSANISGPIEWPLALHAISNFLDSVENYYERGEGKPLTPLPGGHTYFHNSAVWGMRIADAWNLNAGLCRQIINNDREANGDGWFASANQPFYRSVNRVLNPSQQPAYDPLSTLDWLREHITPTGLSDNTGGVENLLLWLGNNNVLGTALSLKPEQTPIGGLNGIPPHQLNHVEREQQDWNFWHPDHFKSEYEELIRQVDEAMRLNPNNGWKVFVANVPHVTIIPLIKGLGEQYPIKRLDRNGNTAERTYFKYYGYFFLNERDIHAGNWEHLTLQQALLIDDCIDEYNRAIDAILASYNDQHGITRYHLVDVNTALAKLAWKRNNGMPTYPLPAPLKFLHPPINTKYYHAIKDGDKNVLKHGGFFSLDGVHPTAIGHGIIASEFLTVMMKAGVTDQRSAVVNPNNLNWQQIIGSDSLYQSPIALVQEFYQHNELIDLFKRLGKLF